MCLYMYALKLNTTLILFSFWSSVENALYQVGQISVILLSNTHNDILHFPLALLMCAVFDGDPQAPKAMLTFLFVSEAEESQLT